MATANDPLTAFEKYLADADCARLTISDHLRDVRLFGRCFEQINGRVLSPKLLAAQDVRDYRQRLLRRKAAAATINRKLASLATYARWARSAGLSDIDPTENRQMIARPPMAPKCRDRQEQGTYGGPGNSDMKLAWAKADFHQAQKIVTQTLQPRTEGPDRTRTSQGGTDFAQIAATHTIHITQPR